jgi:hypothetical protein
VRACSQAQGHIRELAIGVVEADASTHGQHHMMVMKSDGTGNATSNIAVFIEKKVITISSDEFGQSIFFSLFSGNIMIGMSDIYKTGD